MAASRLFPDRLAVYFVKLHCLYNSFIASELVTDALIIRYVMKYEVAVSGIYQENHCIIRNMIKVR